MSLICAPYFRRFLRVLNLTALAWVIPAQARIEITPIQEKAQGQSLVGANLMNDSLYSNPAGSAFTSVYSVDGMFISPRTFAVSILDTKTSSVGGALGYFRNTLPGQSVSIQGAKLGLSSKVARFLAVGLSGKTIWGAGLNGGRTRLTDFDSGALADFKLIQLGLSVRNIGGGEAQFGEEREWSIGGRINYEETLFFSVASQSKWSNPSPFQIGFGAEYVSPYYFSLKGGFRFRPQENTSFWSAGASILSPKVSFHYAVDIPNREGAAMEHTLGTTLLF